MQTYHVTRDSEPPEPISRDSEPISCDSEPIACDSVQTVHITHAREPISRDS